MDTEKRLESAFINSRKLKFEIEGLLSAFGFRFSVFCFLFLSLSVSILESKEVSS